MAPLKMNTTQGIPGGTNFRHKLPKYVTKASLTLAVFHLRQSFKTLKEDISIEENEFIAQTLSRILPSLHVDICKHFALTTGLTSDHDPEDSGGRHVFNPDTTESCPEEEQSPETIDGESDFGIQCIWCNNPTESDNEKPLCGDCVAIPSRILSLEIQVQDGNNETQSELNTGTTGQTNAADKNDDATNERTCRICDQKCDKASFICMRCKCINNRLDHLTMEMNKVKHAIDAILDTPQRSAPPTQTGASATRDVASSSQRGPSGVASSQQRGTSSSRSPVPPNLRGASSSQGVASSRDKEEAFPPLPSQTSTNKRGPPQPAPPGVTQPAPAGVTHFAPHGTTLPVHPRATAPPFAHQPRHFNNFPPFLAHYHDDVYLFQSHSSPRKRWIRHVPNRSTNELRPATIPSSATPAVGI